MTPPVQITSGLLLMLGLVGAGMSVFSDTVIAALPVLQAALSASDHDLQQLVSLYFLATALMSLVAGALADAYGRRPVLLGSLLLLVLSSAGCVVSEHIEQLWGLRILQGAAACVGMILSRTIIRDLAAGVAAQKMIGQVSLVQALFPVLTPLLGAWVAAWYGWRMVFVSTGALALVMLLAFARVLPETLPVARRQPLRPALLGRAYFKVLGSGVFLRMAIAQALNWAAMFLYIAAAPKVMVVLLGAEPTEVYQLFAAIMLPMLLGLSVLPRLLRKHRPRSVVVAAYGCYLVAIGANLAISFIELRSLTVLAPLALFSFAIGLTVPLLVGESLEPFPDNAGMASSCQMFIQYVIMGLTAGVLAPLVWHSLLGMATAQAAMVAAGFVLLLWQRRVVRRMAVATG